MYNPIDNTLTIRYNFEPKLGDKTLKVGDSDWGGTIKSLTTEICQFDGREYNGWTMVVDDPVGFKRY